MRDEKTFFTISLALMLLANGLLFATVALGAEEISPGRRLWDNIMMWFNFAILVFFFVKFARKPLMNYLRGVKGEIEGDLNGINSQLEAIKSEMDEEAEKIKNIEDHIKLIKESILEIGRKEKEGIVEQGRSAAKKMIRDATEYAHLRLAMAKKTLSNEMVDMAMSMVEEKLLKGISEEDNDKIIDRFMGNLEKQKAHMDTPSQA